MAAPPSVLLLTNARVRKRNQSVAIAGDQIVSLGGDVPGAEVVDCQGGTLLPGFHDAHIHLLAAAARLSTLDCSACRSIADLQAAVRARARGLPPGTWVRATGYDETLLGRHPTRQDLDQASPEHPVRLQHRSYHATVASTLALRLAGINTSTEAPPGGQIDREVPSGQPSGLLFEAAQELLRPAIPPPSEQELFDNVAAFSEQLLGWGITAVQDATASNGMADWRLLQRLPLKQRATMMFGYPAFASGGDLPPGGIKIVLDETTGVLHPPLELLRQQVLEVHRAGRQVALHVVTSEALDAALDALAALPRRDGPPHRIEHCSLCTAEQARRIAALGLLVSTQPGFIHYSGDRYLAQVPEGQRGDLYPLRRLLRVGVPLAGGSDAPIAPADPFVALHAAVTRASESGGLVGPKQSVAVGQALEMYTAGSAAAIGRQGDLGRIAPGFLADLVLLPEDPAAISTDRLPALRPALVMVGGQVLLDRRY